MEMVSYNVDSSYDLQVVVTHDGTKEYRVNCKTIKGEYFVKEKHCFVVENKWYRVNSGLIALNHSSGEWFLISKKDKLNLMHGIVDFEKGAPVMGYFTKDAYNAVQVMYQGHAYHCINEKVALLFTKESPCRGLYIATGEMTVDDLRIKNVMNNQNQQYNIEDDVFAFNYSIDLYNKYVLPLPKAFIKYGKYLGDITYGQEIECIRGYLPQHLQNRHGIIICRDGSLKDDDGTQGPEYTTVPMTGPKGLLNMNLMAKEISMRNEIDHRCSYHLHIGNIPTNRVFIVALYKLCLMIQEELFLMFPYFKQNEMKYAGKNKNYCQKLEPDLLPRPCTEYDEYNYNNYIHDSYLRIYKFLLEGAYPSTKFNRKNKKHTKAHKWERHSRYYWVNFINLISSQRNTVEFRLHTATMNSQKMITWLFICNAIIKTASYKANDIMRDKQISLMEVLGFYRDFHKTSAASTISEYLMSYFMNRKLFFEMETKAGKFISKVDLAQDKDFKMEYSFINELFK